MPDKVFEIETHATNPRLVTAATIPQAVRRFKQLLVKDAGRRLKKDERRRHEVTCVRLLGPLN